MSNEAKFNEALEKYPTYGEIISVNHVDDGNHWRDFFCVEKMDPQAKVPTKGSVGSAGWDLYSFENKTIPPQSSAVFSTKIRVAMPPGTYGRIAPRSGLSVKHNLDVGAGVIDGDYQGEILVLLRNTGKNKYYVQAGDKIAQLILTKYYDTDLKVVGSVKDLFGSTKRGSDGFGSTGR